AVDLNGTLDITIAPTFLPSRGEAFDVLTFVSQTGDFATFNGLTIDSNRALVPVRTDKTYSLTSVVAGIKIDPLTGLQTSEAGGSATFTIELEDIPSAPVTINLAPSDSGEGVLNLQSVTFDSSNWNVPQTVTITGVDDDVDDGDQPYSIVTSPVISDDPLYSGLDPSDVNVVNVDDDEVGFTVSTPSTTQTSESGSGLTTVVLDLADVVGGGDGTGTGGSRGINPLTGEIVSTQTGTLLADGSTNVFTAVPTSSFIDGVFVPDGGASGSTSITVSSTGLTVTGVGDGDSRTWDHIWNGNNQSVATVHPTNSRIGFHANKAITFDLDAFESAHPGLEASSFSTLVAIEGDSGSVEFSVVVDGSIRNQVSLDGNGSQMLSTTLANSDRFLTLIATDRGAYFSDHSIFGDPTLTLAPESPPVELTVVLDSQPTADVTIAINSSDETEGKPSIEAIVFTPDDWDQPRNILVIGQDDSVDDGDIAYDVTISVSGSADSLYASLANQQLNLTNVDDDTAGITVSAPATLETTEAGGVGVFSIALDSQPLQDVSIDVNVSDQTEASIAPAIYTFTPNNWNQPRTFTVTGVDDLLDDGNVPYQITFTATSSADPLYNAIQLNPISAVNVGTDTYELTLTDVDTSALNYDSQNLTVQGEITATVTNVGPIDVTGAIEVAFFEDANLDGLFDASVDNLLGSAIVTGPLASGASTPVSATLSGDVQFVDNVIWGVVDSTNAIHELDEMNNYARHECVAGTTVADVSDNLYATAVTASGFWNDNNVPFNAFDGTGASWNAGGFPQQWIEADLGRRIPLSRVNLIPVQAPSTATTTHEVWVSDSPIGNTRLNAVRAKRLTSATTNREAFQINFDQPIEGRYIQILTTSSPSWVAWQEIDVFGATGLPAPDLTASFIRTNASGASGASVDVVARIGNGGSADTPVGVPVAVYNGDPSAGGVLIGTAASTSILGPGEFEDVTITVPSGFAQLWVVADDNGTGTGIVVECDENNNSASVDAQPQPDLSIEVLTATATAQTDEQIPVSWRVKNLGLASAEASWSDRVYLSTDQTLDASDTLLAQFSRTADLATEASYDAQLDVTMPRDAIGDFYLLFATDAGGSIIEFDEANNLVSAAIRIDPAPTPDLVFTSASISDESIQPGREVTVRWTAQNLGDAATGGNWTDVVYLSPDGTVANGI
uniref:CARDB domain-containing protein n=1 Tax=Stieleria sp. TaxID=2795976 RepID=UPI00356A1B7A